MAARSRPRVTTGEGEGRNAVYLASQGFECVSSDPSKKALEKAEKLAALKGVRIQTLKADTLAALATGPYDAIVSVFCAYSTAEERKEAHSMIGKALQPGGRYLYVGFGSEHIHVENAVPCLLYTSPSPRDISGSRMPSSA